MLRPLGSQFLEVGVRGPCVEEHKFDVEPRNTAERFLLGGSLTSRASLRLIGVFVISTRVCTVLCNLHTAESRP